MARGPGDEILLRAQLIPDTVYVNQQVTLRAQTWISEDTQLRLRRAPEYHPPNIPGFWIHDLPGPIQHGRQLFGERPYRVQEFQRAYFPLGPGEYPLPPAKLVYEVRRSFLYTTDDQTLATDSLRLVVLPFPEEGRTPLFDGAVGKFNIRASLEPATVPAGEATALVLEVEGKGNLKALPPPRLPVLNGVDLYPPGENSEIDIRQGEIAGVKRFTWVIVPREPGDLEIPALEYHYFDPELRQYSVARADPLSLTVQPGEDDGSTPAVPGTLRPLKAQPTGSEPLGWVRSPLFALILAMPLLALAPLILWRRRQLRPQTAPPTSPRSRIRHRRRVIDELRGQIQGQENQFFHDLAELIRREVALFIGVNAPARGGAPQIAAALEEKGVAIATAKALGRLLGRIENARYQPVIPGTEIREELLAETERILSILDRQPRKTDRTNGRRTRGKAAPSTTITGLLLLMIPAASFAYAEHSDFQRAINHFHAGEYHSAAQGFSEYLRSSPRDQHAWYNLGNAAYLAGQRGAALQAWLHALRIAPRDGDTRHNLRLAGVDPRLIGDATRQIPISEEELFLLGGIAWLIGIGAICTYLLTRTRAHRLTGITAVGIALGVLLIHLTVPRTPAAVALSEQVPLRVAPNHRADTIRTLDEGARLLIRERRGEWLRIATTPTAEGWVEDHLVGEF
jgi:TolA-binding protein